MSTIKVTTALNKITNLIVENPSAHVYAIVGGQSCSKTFSILLLLINRCLNMPNTEVLCVSHQLSKMKLSVIKDFKFILQDFNLYDENSFKADVEYHFDNGSIFRFVGADRTDFAKGLRVRGGDDGKSGYVFINEANKINYETYRQIASRAPIVLLDWNADYESYIERRVLPLKDTAFLRLNIYDNEAAPENEVKEIESYKEMGFNSDGTIKDEFYANMYNVWGLGLTGRAIGTIYSNWTIGEYKENTNGQNVYGLDFGFSNDPDALIKISVDNNNKIVYCKECLYKNGNSSDELAELLKNECVGKLIIADCAEDRLIEDLKRKNINIQKCKKNKVDDDIKKLQGYKLVVDENATNLQYELNNYIWLDKNSKSIPIDKNNHLLDAMRYAFNFLCKPIERDSIIVW